MRKHKISSHLNQVLLKDAQEDPIKKASLIWEIIGISLIPNAITRSVYVQKVSLIFDINENTITHELLQLRQKVLFKSAHRPNKTKRAKVINLFSKT